MSRTLYLLVTSEQPDTYLNSILHCVLHEGVGRVEFLYIQGLGESTQAMNHAPSDKQSSKVWYHVTTLLESLATASNYIYFTGASAGRKKDLAEVYPADRLIDIKSMYRLCREIKVQWGHRDIPHSRLQKEIATISAAQPPAIVDVSSVKKIYLGDLIASGFIERLDYLCTFDLRIRPDHDHPWTMLFHDLKKNDSSAAKYDYVNLLDTEIFREYSKSLLVRRPPLLISIGLALAFLVVTLVAYFASGPNSIIVQITFLLSSIASILSLFYSLYPLRR
jgi:hypothetical protein